MSTMTTTTARERFEALVRDAIEFTGETFDLKDDAQYQELLDHIEDHKYLTNEIIPYEITMRDALYSWHQNVYEPMTLAIEREGVNLAFPNASKTELFLWVCRHWHFLKEKKRRIVTVEEAIRSFAAQYGEGKLTRFFFRMKLAAA